MIDSLVTNRMNLLLAATNLIWADFLQFILSKPLLFTPATAGFGDQIGWAATRTYFANEITHPFFYPNCYPFRNSGGTTRLGVYSMHLVPKRS